MIEYTTLFPSSGSFAQYTTVVRAALQPLVRTNCSSCTSTLQKIFILFRRADSVKQTVFLSAWHTQQMA